MSEELALALAQQEQQEVDLQLERDKRLSVALHEQFAMEFDAEEKERKKKLQEMVKNDERYMMQLAAEEEAGTNAAQSIPSDPTPAEPGPAVLGIFSKTSVFTNVFLIYLLIIKFYYCSNSEMYRRCRIQPQIFPEASK